MERRKKEMGNGLFFLGSGISKIPGWYNLRGAVCGEGRRDVIGRDTVELLKLAFGGILHIPMEILVHGVDHPRANPCFNIIQHRL